MKGQYGRVSTFAQKYADILSFNKIGSSFLDIDQLNFWEQVAGLDFLIYQWGQWDYDRQIAQTVLPIVENEYKVTCFPDRRTSWHFDDKVAEYYLLRAHGFPMIKSWIFWDREKALSWVETAKYPVVFKLKSGAGSNGVVLVKKPEVARCLINRMFGKGIIPGEIPVKGATQWKDFNLYKFARHKVGNLQRRMRGEDAERCWVPNKNYALFQQFLPNNDFDTRVTIIGQHAFAFRRFNRDNDFRSSGSGKINYDPAEVDLNHVRKAFEISRTMGFQSMAYDFLYNENGKSEICEISYTYIDQAIFNCPGHWDSNLNWHSGHYWPQTMILNTLLSYTDLAQPSFDK
ncbi:MAG: hypothetical protein U1C46_05655 [Bacteroidales bacterium]|nr:hypothetical protein [Bacteroidales bacterium]